MSGFKPALNVGAAREALKTTRRAHIKNALSDSDARALQETMTTADWRLTFHDKKMAYDLTPANVAALDVGASTRLLDSVHQVGREGFEFLYDTFRIHTECDAGRPCPEPFAELYAALNGEAWMSALRALTGDDRIAVADAQATRYRPGHFLTAHDDLAPSSGRLYAYVLNLSSKWRVDWGGLLMFHSPEGHVVEAFAPSWNALNIFQVPQEHSVSMVSPLAAADRLSITGWLKMAGA